VPDIPAIAEMLPGYDVTSWLGIMVPAGTPSDIRGKIAGTIAQFVQDEAIVRQLKDLGAVAAKPNSPADFAAIIGRDFEKWGRVVRDTGIKLGD
jgi:tripartite-type tricarboxylate transporter receptor subunit TctC